MTGNSIPYYKRLFKRISFTPGRLCFVLLFSICLQNGIAQTGPDIEELMVEFSSSDVGSTSVSTLIIHEKAWLSVPEVFEFLKINHFTTSSGDSLYGFFLNTATNYLLDAKLQQVHFKGIATELPAGALMHYKRGLFLRADLFNNIFQLDCRFDFKLLSVNLFTTLELPVAMERKQELMRSNINKYGNTIKTDTTIRRVKQGLHSGMMDWSLNATNDVHGFSDFRANVIIGSMIAGGEATVSLQYNDKTVFASNQQYYLWRHINNDNNLVRQFSIGKIATNATSSIFSPVIGVQFSNSPTIFRRTYGTYRINKYTEPNWLVELYLNNTLVAYKRADPSGFFSFDIPLVYGNTQLQFRYFGPNGEQRNSDENISMPYTFLPVRKLEYTVSAGMVENSPGGAFSRTQINFGLLKTITIGGGMEYLSSIKDRKLMPFLNANFRISRNMLFTTEYTHGVRSNITGNYRLFSNLLFEVNYTRYVKGQQAIYNTYLEERRAAVSFPLRFKGFSSYSRFSFYQIVLPASKYTTAEGLLSGMLFGVNTNFTTYALFTDNTKPYLYSNLSMAFWLPGKFMLMPQAQFEYNKFRFISLRGEVQKRISAKGYINGFYEDNFKSNFTSINIGFRYDLSFAQMGLAVRKSSGTDPALISSFNGSILRDERVKYNGFTSTPNVGRGALILLSFLDLNNNGKWDKGEPKVAGLRFSIPGGIPEENKKDTTTIIRNLEAYNSYLLTIDKSSFEEIAWKIGKSTYKVEIDPNSFKLIEIPVSVLAEISGTVYKETAKGNKPQERILINIYNNLGIQVAQTLSEADGYFSYLGLAPGSYLIKPDPEQMRTLGLRFSPKGLHFEIAPTYYGDVLRDINFTLTETDVKK